MTRRNLNRWNIAFVVFIILGLWAADASAQDAPPTVTVHSVHAECDTSWVALASVGLLLLVVPFAIIVGNVVNAIGLHIKRRKR